MCLSFDNDSYHSTFVSISLEKLLNKFCKFCSLTIARIIFHIFAYFPCEFPLTFDEFRYFEVLSFNSL